MLRVYRIGLVLLASLLLMFCQQKQPETKAAAGNTQEQMKPMGPETAPAGAEEYFISPKDGDTVPQTFTVRFGLKGMGVAPAGIKADNTGHHHILIDVDQMPDMTKPLPATEHIKHFGSGATETELTLTPGKHTLQLVLGDYAHIPFDPPIMSQKITITVK